MALVLTLLVLLGAIVLFVTEKLPVDVVALLVLSSLLLLGLVTPAQALSGFSSQATITVASMFVLSAGLQRSGLLLVLGEALSAVRWGWLLALVMIVLVSAMSAFINNTAMVAVFLPLVMAATAANRQPASRFLIPLSYAAQMGGVCTLVGTSTNLVVDSLARQAGQAGFTLFEFAPLGLVFVAVGTAYLLLARTFLLPDLGIPDATEDEHRGRYVAELHVPAESPAIGKAGSAVLPLDAGDVHLLEIVRDRVPVARPREDIVRAGDRLLVRGPWREIEQARKRLKLAFDPVARDLDGDPAAPRVHADVMVAPGSHLIGQTLRSRRFGHIYRVRVHGLQRVGSPARLPLDHVPLAVGDILLVDAPVDALDMLRMDPGLVVLGQRAQPRVNGRQAAISLGVLLAVVGVSAFGWLPLVAAALLGCVALVVLRCLTPDEAYAAIDWRVIVLLAGVLPLGFALEHSGGAAWVTKHVFGLVADHGPVAMLAAVYLATALLTEAMSNNAAAALLVPIAISIAASLHVDAKPFLVAVAFAASTSFATPVGYQTNTMVYGAGGYRFADFPRFGLPLNLLFWALAVLLIPRYFPFYP